MRTIHANEIKEVVKTLVMDAEYFIPSDFIEAIKEELGKINRYPDLEYKPLTLLRK